MGLCVCDQMYAERMVIMPAIEVAATISMLRKTAVMVMIARNKAAIRVILYRVDVFIF